MRYANNKHPFAKIGKYCILISSTAFSYITNEGYYRYNGRTKIQLIFGMM